MKVKVLPGQAITNGPALVGAGSVVDLPAKEAQRMIDCGVCGEIAPPKPKKAAPKTAAPKKGGDE